MTDKDDWDYPNQLPQTEPEPERKSRPRAAGLFLLPYVLQYLRGHTITPRQAILLTHVDRAVNSWRDRHPDECRDDDSDWTPWIEFSTVYLREILCCNEQTVHNTIMGLVQHRAHRHLFKKTRLSKLWWRLETKKRTDEQNKGDALHVPPKVRRAFEGDELSPMEMLAMGKIAGFFRAKQPCYMANPTIGKFFGLSGQRAQQIVRALIRKGWLRSKLFSHDMLRSLLAEQGEHYRGSGGRTCRLLMPTDKLLPRQSDSDDEETG